jgi:catechol 2,3-dioxygenase-like lactoylglutathione lyase family enzyme
LISYVTVGAADLVSAGRFYDAALSPLGLARLSETDSELGYGPVGGKAMLWVMRPFDGNAASFGNGIDIAFDAPSRAAVDAFHAAAMAHGGTDEGGPGLRPNYHADFYTAYVRDPTGNKLNAVCEKPAGHPSP